MRNLPAGTRVLTPDDRVGVVIAHLPDTQCELVFSDGWRETHRASDLRLYSAPPDVFPEQPNPESLRPYIIYSAIVGSTAYGLAREGSDVDRRGIYLPPAAVHWSLPGAPDQLEFKEQEETYWELEKFLRLALRANPNVMECLYSPMVEKCTPIARELVEMRHIFLSRLAHQTYSAYVLSQFQKIKQDLRNRGEIRWKHVMHLLRLLLSGITVIRDGMVPLDVGPHRDRLLAIRRGEVEWEAAEKWRQALQQEFDDALSTTKLPDLPDFDAVNRFLIRARRSMVEPVQPEARLIAL